jgi:hypothetical protein
MIPALPLHVAECDATLVVEPWCLKLAPCGHLEDADSSLFNHAGIHLPESPTQPTTKTEPSIVVSVYDCRGRAWKVYHNATLAKIDVSPDQPMLDLPMPAAKVTRVITSEYALYMNATIRGFFGNSRLLENASRHLMLQDILYVGDLTKMTRPELELRLGRYRCLVGELEERLRSVGLALNASASWWDRPADYYSVTF